MGKKKKNCHEKYFGEICWESVYNVFKCKLYDSSSYENATPLRTPNTLESWINKWTNEWVEWYDKGNIKMFPQIWIPSWVKLIKLNKFILSFLNKKNKIDLKS